MPTFVYWKNVISPRKSDGLFDLGDIFNTCISIAGMNSKDLSKRVGQTRYVDGVDQTSFFLADKGQSNRYSRIYTLNQYLSAVRIDEFKCYITVEDQEALFNKGYTGGFSGAIYKELGGTVAVNLYTDPQEDISVGIRHIPLVVLLGAEMKRYQNVLEKYPPQVKVSFGGN